MAALTVKPLSILHVMLSDGYAGSERYCIDLAAKQCAQGHRVGIVGRRPRKGAISLFEHIPDGVTAYSASRLFASRTIASAAREQAADIINLYLPDSAGAVRRLRQRPPAVMTLHLRYRPEDIRKLDGLVRTADWQAQETAEYTGPTTTAYNWPPALSAASLPDVTAARGFLGAGQKTFVVGSLARLHRVKRAELLIAAYRRAALPDSMLVLVGSGPERAVLEQCAKGNGSIRFLGHRDDISVWHQAIDLFVLPSDWEAMPLGVLEAMQLGTPIIATACAGTAEVLRGSRAVLIPPGDELALMDALRAAKIAFANGRLNRAPYDLSRFNPEIALAQIESFYRHIISLRRV